MGQADRLVHEEVHPSVLSAIELILECIDGAEVDDICGKSFHLSITRTVREKNRRKSSWHLGFNYLRSMSPSVIDNSAGCEKVTELSTWQSFEEFNFKYV